MEEIQYLNIITRIRCKKKKNWQNNIAYHAIKPLLNHRKGNSVTLLPYITALAQMFCCSVPNLWLMTNRFWPSTKALPLEQSTVNALALSLDSKHYCHRMVFSVVLFPVPVFPIIMILSSSLFTLVNPA